MVALNVTVNNCTPQTIVIGRRGTYDTLQIAFDLDYLIENYGNGTAVLAIKRSQDESAYPAIITQEDSTLLWTVNETDTAYVGSGECQLMWYVDGGLAKTIIYPMVVMRDILQTAEQPPDGYENWIEHLTELGAETQQNAQNAAQSASDAEQSATDAGAAKDAANEAVLHYPKIENGYWYVWDVTAQAYQNTNIKAEGDDGYSPEVTITSIEGGHRITITDKDHPQGQSFDVLDGQGGGGTSDYTDLTNKPQINGHTLTGNQTAEQLDLATPSDIPTDAGDIEYDESATYQAGSVGAELQEQTRQLSDVEENQIPELKNAISQLQPTATASDVGKALIVKTVDTQTGKPTSYEYGDGSGGAVDDVQINGTSIVSSGVANIPLATSTSVGVVQPKIGFGLTVGTDGVVVVDRASTGDMKSGANLFRPITSNIQHISTFYGLAKAAGDSTQYASANPVGTYTEDAKNAIHGMLNGAVTVSGTTPTIAAKDGITYVCGEVATLDITLPASGIFEVQFVSGSTPTVLTATGVSWAGGFDPTALEANKTYDISISNGIGVAVWI